jgi:hypothetical protein
VVDRGGLRRSFRLRPALSRFAPRSAYNGPVPASTHEPFIRESYLLRERVRSFDEYPFNIPAIRGLDRLPLHPKVTYFVGENGTGKSTLLEAIAVVENLNAEASSPRTRRS